MARGTLIMGLLLLACLLVTANSLGSAAENVSKASAFDYKDALGKAILFFEGQRSGELPYDQRVTWRGDSALNDGSAENVKLRGGYYDAGDNVKFSWPMSFSVSLLSWAVVEFKSRISSASQIEYLQSAIRWGADFILAAHTTPTTFYTQVGDGNADHNCWERPEDMDTPRTLYKITSSSPGTEAAADASAALAAASIVFRRADSSYSSELLSQSQSLFDFAEKYRGSYSGSCPFYCSYSGYQDELLWAAAWLYKASRNSKYLNFILNNQRWSQSGNEFSWDNKFPGVHALLSKEYMSGETDLWKFKNDVDSFVCALMPQSSSRQIQTTPGGLLFTRDSSNLQYVTSASMVLFIYSKTLNAAKVNGVQCGSVHLSTKQIRAFAKSQVDYILGNNPQKMSYMVGFGTRYPLRVHHRGASIPSIGDHPRKISCGEGQSYYNADSANPNTHVGAIVGGPNANDQFNDVRTDYSHLEPTTYINAAMVGSLAAVIPKAKTVTLRTNLTADMGHEL